MQQGDTFTLHCDALTLAGVGIGRHAGAVVFVPLLLPGEDAEVSVTDVRKNFVTAAIVRRLTDAPERIEPDCPFVNQCGGCAFRHISYDAERLAKEQAVRDALRRFRVEAPVLPCLGASTERPRNKAVFHFTEDGKPGFFSAGSHTILPIRDCLLLPSLFNEIAWETASLCHICVWKPLYLLVRASTDGQITVVLSLPGVTSADRNLLKLTAALTSRFPMINGILIGSAEQPEAEQKSPLLLYGDAYLTDKIGPLTLRSASRSFRQVNFAALDVLLAEIDRAADLRAGETVADLYCGTGMIGQYLAALHPGTTITGVEINENAVRDAEYNAKRNGLSSVRYFCGDAARYVKEAGKVDLAILDPPRAGLSDAMCRQILDLRPGRIVYVSCNPSSMAHDISKLVDVYKPVSVRPVDMFPRTGNTESVAVLKQK